MVNRMFLLLAGNFLNGAEGIECGMLSQNLLSTDGN